MVTLSQRGYIKRQQIGTFRSQRRGGRGKLAMLTREEDAVRHLLVANTHDNILFFTNRGRVFITKVHTLPEATRQAKGLPIINLPGVQVESGEYVSSLISLPGFEPEHYLLMATSRGMVKKTSLAEYAKIRANGLIAINLIDGDELRWVGITDGPQRHHPGHAQGTGGPIPRGRGALHGPRHPRRDRHPAAAPATRWSAWRSWIRARSSSW